MIETIVKRISIYLLVGSRRGEVNLPILSLSSSTDLTRLVDSLEETKKQNLSRQTNLFIDYFQ